MCLISSGESRPNWISLMLRSGALECGKLRFDILANCLTLQSSRSLRESYAPTSGKSPYSKLFRLSGSWMKFEQLEKSDLKTKSGWSWVRGRLVSVPSREEL